jgi:cobalamin biosynthetic protein CobC
MRDHGGDLDRAKARYGRSDWIDLSTGINPIAYPIPKVPFRAFHALPTAEDTAALEATAAHVYGAGAETVALAGAQAAIQLVPRLVPPGRAAVLAPSYNEHAAALRAEAWDVADVTEPESMGGVDLAVVVNPNNPDGRHWSHETLEDLASRVGLLVVDESFADPHPELSLAPRLADLGERVLVLRSFGKFYGLAGLRLGFALGGTQTVARLRALAGPWAVGGPAIAIGKAAFSDKDWRQTTTARLIGEATRLDQLAAGAGWQLVGGTALFRTYETGDAAAEQERLARAGIWTRRFPYSSGWLRLGLPGTAAAGERLIAALTPSGQ